MEARQPQPIRDQCLDGSGPMRGLHLSSLVSQPTWSPSAARQSPGGRPSSRPARPPDRSVPPTLPPAGP